MIWSTEKRINTVKETENEIEVEKACMFDITLNTNTPFSDIILESIANKMKVAYEEMNATAYGRKEFGKLLSTLEYIRMNYPNIRNLAVDDESFSVKASCLDCDNSPEELEVELYIDVESNLYLLIREHLAHEWRKSEPPKSTISEDETSEVTNRPVHNFI